MLVGTCGSLGGPGPQIHVDQQQPPLLACPSLAQAVALAQLVFLVLFLLALPWSLVP